MNNNGRDPSNSPQVFQELKFLRAKVASLEAAAKTAPAAPAAPKGPVVEFKPDSPRAVGLLRDLLVATENFFGPEAGKETPSPSKELRQAMTAAAALVRKTATKKA